MTNAWISGRFSSESEAPPGRPRRVKVEASGTVVRNNQPDGNDAAADQWVPLGPVGVVRGTGFGQPTVSGRVRAIAASDDGQRAYIGAALGGVWYTDDGGATWLCLDTYASTPDLSGTLREADALAIGALAVQFDPSGDASKDIVYAATGEQPGRRSGFGEVSMSGIGIRRAVGPVDQVRNGGPDADPWTLETGPGLEGTFVARLAVDTVVDGRVWAATGEDLYRRDPTPTPTWHRVDTLPTGAKKPATNVGLADVLVVSTGAGTQILYASERSGILRFSLTGDAGSWQNITLPKSAKGIEPKIGIGRMTLAAARKGIANPVLYAVAEGPRLWRIEGTHADVVRGVDKDIFGKQASYDMAIAASPTLGPDTDDTVAVGGQGLEDPTGADNAALYTGRVRKDGATYRFIGTTQAGPPNRPGWVGLGVHPDVQVLAWVPGFLPGLPTVLWVGCDGGVFRSSHDGDRHTFRSVNSGLAVTEMTYLAHHATHDGVVLSGTQDNGTVLRLSAEAWRQADGGDGGGVAIDPRTPSRMYHQYTNGSWWRSLNAGQTFTYFDLFSNPSFSLSLADFTWALGVRTKEREAAGFYSSMGIIGDAAASTTQLAVGTDRIWYTDDGLQAKKGSRSGWVTLPTGTDPYAGGTNRKQDHLDDVIRMVKWADKDSLYVLGLANLYHLKRTAGKWSQPDVFFFIDFTDTPAPQIPTDLQAISFAPHQPATGSMYVGTLPSNGKVGVGPTAVNVWWYNGVSDWISTGLQMSGPIYTLVVDPDHRNVVYAGSSTGVWKGVGDFGVGQPPTWVWTHYADGLPEAAVTDLTIYSNTATDPGNRLLRAATSARGVWELALDDVTQGPTLYLRTHKFDSARRAIPDSGAVHPFTGGALPLDGSPDVRVWRSSTADPPPFPGIPIGPKLSQFHIWLVQSALRAAGRAVGVDGTWGPGTATALAAELKDLAILLGANPTPEAIWKVLLAGNRLPFDHDPPDFTDLTAFLQDEPDTRAGKAASCVAGDGPMLVFVAAHSRHWRPVAAADSWVTVLKTPFSSDHQLAGLAALPASWTASLVADITSGAPTGAWLNADWSYLDPTQPARRSRRSLEPLSPQVVSFGVDLAGPAWPDPGWLLLAVTHSTTDPLVTVDTDIATLVRTDHHLAARSVRRAT